MLRNHLDGRAANRVIVKHLARRQAMLIYTQQNEKLYGMLATLSYLIPTGARALSRRPGEERTDSFIRARLIEDIDLLLSGRIISVVLISLIIISG